MQFDTVEVELDGLEEILETLGIQDRGPTIAYTTTRWKDYMDKYVPKSNGYYEQDLFIPGGSLRRSAKVYPEEGIVEYQIPYAHAQYVGYTTGPVRNYTTPGTGKYWNELMWTAEGEQFMDEINRYVEKRTK